MLIIRHLAVCVRSAGGWCLVGGAGGGVTFPNFLFFNISAPTLYFADLQNFSKFSERSFSLSLLIINVLRYSVYDKKLDFSRVKLLIYRYIII